MTLDFVERFAASQTWLDAVSNRLQPVVRKAVAKTGRHGADFLDGVWLGAPLHPAATDVPVGAATAAFALDAIGAVTRSPSIDRQADGALVISVAGALAAATTGLADYRYLFGDTRRLAVAHGLMNAVGTSLNLASLGLRATGRRGAGRLTSALGLTVMGLAAHLGGELTYGRGVRVDPNAEMGGPRDYTPVLDEAELQGAELRRVDVEGEAVLLTRSVNGELCAIGNKCSHFGGPLAEGERDGDTVICPWHASRFDVCTGKVLGGPAVFPQPRFEVRAREGKIELRRA
ncbi:MAG: hypothetical protein QOJ25_3402 [Solirubrobacteraceae bacterium]|jgi:nitrite reductase/ring-hydroxylating ferredoxin subunit/uncharacterized membrane protein|nr:hypothetical protein [Solirubrobacteraceae bacterium]